MTVVLAMRLTELTPGRRHGRLRSEGQFQSGSPGLSCALVCPSFAGKRGGGQHVPAVPLPEVKGSPRKWQDDRLQSDGITTVLAVLAPGLTKLTRLTAPQQTQRPTPGQDALRRLALPVAVSSTNSVAIGTPRARAIRSTFTIETFRRPRSMPLM